MSPSSAGAPPGATVAPSPPTKPLNLTAATEPMSWSDAAEFIGVSGSSLGVALEFRSQTREEDGRVNDGSQETVYVVIAGFGVLRCGGVDMECTGGDVLFVPKGCPHSFQRLDGDMKLWRISPVGLPAGLG
jgi:mannose-6-phosphate isomerase-like protein (cupin superfamily)